MTIADDFNRALFGQRGMKWDKKFASTCVSWRQAQHRIC